MSISTQVYGELASVGVSLASYNVSLAQFSYWKIGGNADLLVEPATISEFSEIRKILKKYPSVPYLMVGDTSNLLFDDEGFHGVIIKIGNNFSAINVDGPFVVCEAGAWVPKLALTVCRNGLSGLEHVCGIPGRVGGLVFMNGGSNRQSISGSLDTLALLGGDGQIKIVRASDLDFSYRTSPFQNGEWMIAEATFKLTYGDVSRIRKQMISILSSRRQKFPRKLPSCGSVFVSDPKMYEVIGTPGHAIEKVGLKGVQFGNAQISPLHANFIVNLGGAKSAEVRALIRLARQKVFEATAFKMKCEVRYVSPEGRVLMAHEEG